MTTSKFAAVALLWTIVLSATPGCGSGQQLVLSADVGQTEFFEDEPIYLLMRLQNVGADTAWTTFFGWSSPALTVSGSRGHGNAVPGAKFLMGYRVQPGWRGVPVPPGATCLQTIVLQDIMGDAWDLRSHFFAHHLTPDQYELHVNFDAHAGVPSTTPLAVEGAPIVFRIRARTTSEENDVRELQAMRHMGWDTTRVAGYPRAVGYQAELIHWVQRRLNDRPDDPFLPFLLYNGM